MRGGALLLGLACAGCGGVEPSVFVARVWPSDLDAVGIFSKDGRVLDGSPFWIPPNKPFLVGLPEDDDEAELEVRVIAAKDRADDYEFSDCGVRLGGERRELARSRPELQAFRSDRVTRGAAPVLSAQASPTPLDFRAERACPEREPPCKDVQRVVHEIDTYGSFQRMHFRSNGKALVALYEFDGERGHLYEVTPGVSEVVERALPPIGGVLIDMGVDAEDYVYLFYTSGTLAILDPDLVLTTSVAVPSNISQLAVSATGELIALADTHMISLSRADPIVRERSDVPELIKSFYWLPNGGLAGVAQGAIYVLDDGPWRKEHEAEGIGDDRSTFSGTRDDLWFAGRYNLLHRNPNRSWSGETLPTTLALDGIVRPAPNRLIIYGDGGYLALRAEPSEDWCALEGSTIAGFEESALSPDGNWLLLSQESPISSQLLSIDLRAANW